jgi:hypothetical protein
MLRGKKLPTTRRGPEIHILMEIPEFWDPARNSWDLMCSGEVDTKIYTKSTLLLFFHHDLYIWKSLILPISNLEIIFSYNIFNLFLIY